MSAQEAISPISDSAKSHKGNEFEDRACVARVNDEEGTAMGGI